MARAARSVAPPPPGVGVVAFPSPEDATRSGAVAFRDDMLSVAMFSG